MGDPNSDVDSTKRLDYHFDMCYPPPYMGIDHQKTPYKEYIPSNFLLYCVAAPPEGSGEGTVCDTEAVLRSLPPVLQRQVMQTALRYKSKNLSGKQYYGGGEYVYPLVMEDPERAGRQILRFTETTESTGKFFQYEQKPDDLLLSEHELKELLMQRIQDRKYTIFHEYQEGDLLIINNHTTLHGREAFHVAGAPRELWRIQIIPEPRKLPPYWEEYVRSSELKAKLEEGDEASVLRIASDMDKAGMKLHKNAIMAYFKYMPTAVSQNLCHELKPILSKQRPQLDDDLAAALIAYTNHVDPEDRADYARWLESMVRHENQVKSVRLQQYLWAALLEVGSTADDFHVYLKGLCPERNSDVPKADSVMAAAIKAYARFKDLEGCRRCFEAASTKPLSLSYAYAFAATDCLEFATALEILEEASASSPPQVGKIPSMAMGRLSSAQVGIAWDKESAHVYGDVINNFLNRTMAAGNEDMVLEGLKRLDSYDLDAAVLGKLVCFTMTKRNPKLKELVSEIVKRGDTDSLHISCNDALQMVSSV